MNLYKYLPYEKYWLESDLSVEEVKQRLGDHIQPSLQGGKPYKGYLEGDCFAISRIITYKNSFTPVAAGAIYTVDGRTVIKVKLRLDAVVMVFMIIWMGIVGMASVPILGFMLFKLCMAVWNGNWPVWNKDFLVLLIPIGMFLLGYCMVMGGFIAERSNTKAFIAWVAGPVKA